MSASSEEATPGMAAPGAGRPGGAGLPDFGAPFPRDAGVSPALVVLPVPWERTVSYGPGTGDGPAAILEASRQVEMWDEELHAVPWLAGISTRPPVAPLGDDVDASVAAIADAVDEVMAGGAVPVVLGGEHSVTPAAVRGAVRHEPGLVVLQVDAHADLRESYEDDRWSHASAMARVRDLRPHVGVGIRALSRPEARLIRRESLPVWWARDCRGDGWIDAVVDRLVGLGDGVWITVDLDGLDPAVVPGVGTPEPGGLGWHATLDLLRACAARTRVVGLDVVELMPRPGDLVSPFAAARLAYRLMGYVLTRGGTEECPERVPAPAEIDA